MARTKNRLFAQFVGQINSDTTVKSTAIEGGTRGTETVADVNALPESPEAGDMAFVSGTNKLYLYNGSTWFNIALTNQAPTAISGNEASYTLATDGTPTVVTLTSTDPEGFPLTWSSTTSGDTQIGTLTRVDNVFTITPSTDIANNGTLNVTFSVTDGTNIETSTSSFTLQIFVYDITAASYNTYIGAPDTSPYEVFFRPNGANMYVIGDTTNDVFQYTLGTPWDITTATYNHSIDTSGGDGEPGGLHFKPDGTIFWTSGGQLDRVAEYAMSTPWDISTASLVRTRDVTGDGLGLCRGLSFSEDGAKFYVLDQGKVYEYTMSTPWDISTSTKNYTFTAGGWGAGSRALYFKPDGLTFWATKNGTSGGNVFEFSLTTAWDISTASYSGTSHDHYGVVNGDGDVSGVFIGGSKMFLVSRSRDQIHEYNLI